uniref:RNA-directed DNA polymerase n=1 Tax=Trichuris muris TaxID=70415 RepID=A0A5S6R0G6_TRIMR
MLWREWYHTDGSIRLQLVVPKEMIPQVLHQCHAAATAGHLGEEKTLARVREQFYWPGYRADVKRYIKTCWECNARDDPVPKGRAPLQSQLADYTWQRIAVDIADAFSKFAEAIPMPNQESTTVATALVHDVFCRPSAKN